MIIRALAHSLLLSSFFFSVSAIDIGFGLGRCNCDGWDLISWSVESIIQCQKVGDFLIAAAYFSIPLELLYFATCANLFPFKWIVLQFGAFIVLCGLTHLLAFFTYEPHSFLLVLCFTAAKFMTALVSFATAITLLTLIPRLLRIKVRENFLRIKARELDREVGLMKRQEEASWYVRMLTHEIRKSLNRHTILYTTMVELSKTLSLQNCAVWMPNESRNEMILTHQLIERSSSSDPYSNLIPIDDPDVMEIKESNRAKILKPDSILRSASSGSALLEPGPVAAIRMPMLRVSNFKGGTPEIIQAKYAILVLVLPRENSRNWSDQELEIVEVVADQVAVALSHASVLEESQHMREKLEEQNRVLLLAQQEALRASGARSSFQITMSEGMRRPMHSIVGLFSMLQMEKLKAEQRLVVDAIAKTSVVLSTLVGDVMDRPTLQQEHFSLVMRPFDLISMVKEAVCVTRSLCESRDIGFWFQVEDSLPDKVIGDEKRVFHVILHMVGTLVNSYSGGGYVRFYISGFDGSEDMGDQDWVPWKLTISDGYICVKFEISVGKSGSVGGGSYSSFGRVSERPSTEASEMGLSFNMCKKLVQVSAVLNMYAFYII
jgi:ethylene receptor